MLILRCEEGGELNVPLAGIGTRVRRVRSLIGKGNVLQKVLVEVWSALFAVVGGKILNIFLGLITHAETMLPYIADLALYHELSSVDIVFAIA